MLHNVAILGNSLSGYEERATLTSPLKATARYVADAISVGRERAIANTFDPEVIFNDFALQSFSEREMSTALEEVWDNPTEPTAMAGSELVL
jgi:hypothetical protein